MTDWAQVFAGFCKERQSKWEAAVIAALVHTKNRTKLSAAPVKIEAITARITQAAKEDLARLDTEIANMMVRTSVMIAASAILFAGLALKPSNAKGTIAQVGGIFAILAMAFTAVAFTLSIFAMLPPIRRAFKSPYQDRYNITPLTFDDFTSWVMYCWLGNRRTKVITRYKKIHAVAIPFLMCAMVCAVPAIATSIMPHWH